MRVLLVSVNSHSGARTAPRKIPRQARSRATVDRILDAAARLFDRDGYVATTTNHVAEEAGVSIGSLYQYFPSKDALLTALAERHLDAATPVVRAMASQVEPGSIGPADLARLLIETAVELKPDALHTLLRDAPHNVDVVDRFAAFRAEMSEVLATHLVAAGHPHERVSLRARLVFDLVDALAHSELMDEPHATAEAVRVIAAALDPAA